MHQRPPAATVRRSPNDWSTADRRASPQRPEPERVLRDARAEPDELPTLEAAAGGGPVTVTELARSRSTARNACGRRLDITRSSSATVCACGCADADAAGQVRIWLYVPPTTDLRKSFDGLAALVRSKLLKTPLKAASCLPSSTAGAHQIKILYFDRRRTTACGHKRLEQGGSTA